MGDSRRPFDIGGPAAASLLVNTLLIGALLNLGMSHAGRTKSPTLTVISLTVLKGVSDGIEEAKAVQPAASTVAVKPSSPIKPVLDEPPPPMVQPVPPTPPALPVPLPPPHTAAALAPTEQSGPQPTLSSPQAAAQASQALPSERRGIADGLDASVPSGTSRSYAAKVRSWLYAHKVYPRRARMRHEEGRVRIRFVIDRAGMLIEGVIVQGSGNSSLDEEAMAMMRRASPFPKAPEDVLGERIEFIAPIEFTLPT